MTNEHDKAKAFLDSTHTCVDNVFQVTMPMEKLRCRKVRVSDKRRSHLFSQAKKQFGGETRARLKAKLQANLC